MLGAEGTVAYGLLASSGGRGCIASGNEIGD